jgi:predicted ATPase/class 3 adenylate cyclase
MSADRQGTAPRPPERGLPTGTVTFLRTDVEGSMRLSRALGPTWDALNGAQIELIRQAVVAHGGTCVRTEGDAVFAAFPEARAAVAAAIAAQRDVVDHPWPADAQVRVRMGLHSGEAHLAGDDYGGFEVNRAARIAAAGHGGQIVASEATRALAADGSPGGVTFADLGPHLLKDVPHPERLFQVRAPDLPVDFPPLRAARQTVGRLPERLTSFLGRERELSELTALAADARLITLTGPGGIGKSSLAVELARSLAPAYPDGAWFVALGLVEDPGHVTAAIARAIGLFDGPERSAATALAGYLAERSVLLVLDNAEHVLAASDEFAALLRASPASRLVVTSRAPLRIAGEQEYPVRPLGGDAVPLFVERARAVRPDWEPGGDGALVAELCALLDGLPLGIELAAARVSILPLRAIRDRLAARLPLPGAGPRDAPERQRTLDGAVAWSHDLLDPDLQALLHDLAVFDGGFDLEQAEAIARGERPGRRDTLGDIVELAEQSLLARDAGPSDSERAATRVEGVRFRMLRTIGSFALERLIAEGREAPVRRRHAVAFLALADEAAVHYGTFEGARWLDRLALDTANLRGAVRWAIDAGDADLALRLVASLWRFWQADGHLSEGRTLTEDALRMPGAAASGAHVWAVGAAGNIAYWQADTARARTYYEQQLALAEALDDGAAIADAYFNLVHVAFIDRDEPEAQVAAVEEARRRFLQIGDERGAARTRFAMGTIAMGAGRPEEAAEILGDALATFDALGDAQYHAMALASRGWAAFAAGDVETACRWSARSIVETHALRDVGTTTISLHIGVLIAVLRDRPEDAARLTGAFEALCERYGVRPPAALGTFIARLDPFQMAREAISAPRWEVLVEAGRSMELDEAVALIVAIADEDPAQ